MISVIAAIIICLIMIPVSGWLDRKIFGPITAGWEKAKAEEHVAPAMEERKIAPSPAMEERKIAPSPGWKCPNCGAINKDEEFGECFACGWKLNEKESNAQNK